MPGFHFRSKRQAQPLQFGAGLVSGICCTLILLTGCKGTRDQGVVFKQGQPLKYKEDQFGNRIPDYSTAGYGSGAVIPDVPVALTLSPSGTGVDDTVRIQDAINELSQRPMNADGFRGALLLKGGKYSVSGQLVIKTSGVVLRGEGQFEEGTIIRATGNQRRSLIVLSGSDLEQDRYNKETNSDFQYRPYMESSWEVVDDYVPSGSSVVQVSPVKGLAIGETVILEQRMNQAWVNILGMDAFPPRPDKQPSKPWDPLDFVFQFERKIEKIEGGRVHLSATVVNPIFSRFGETRLFKPLLPKRISRSGVEELRLVSEFQESQNNQNEAHAWNGVEVARAKDCWVRGVNAVHFGNSTVTLGKEAIRITVEECAFLKPIAKFGYGRRHGFVNGGQQGLIQRCFAEDCAYPFFIPERTCGPNVFLDCYAKGDKSIIGPWRYWAMGTLWDNVYGKRLMIRNRGYDGGGWGWSGINHMFWNSTAFDTISVQSPINGWNWAIGCRGIRIGGPFQGLTGRVSSHGSGAKPRSLFMKQLQDRVGKDDTQGIFTANQSSGAVFFHIRDTLSEN